LGWDRASKPEYDAWATFSDPSSTTWNYANLLPYFKKTETVDIAFFDEFPGVSKAGYAAARNAMEKQVLGTCFCDFLRFQVYVPLLMQFCRQFIILFISI